MENQHKNHTSTNHQPLITSCKDTPHHENNLYSMDPSTRVVGEALLMQNASDVQEEGSEDEPVGREKLVRHWKEVSFGGRVVVPETWEQEDLLKDWIDYSTFDALLAPKGAGFAREALVAEARRKRDVSKLSV